MLKITFCRKKYLIVIRSIFCYILGKKFHVVSESILIAPIIVESALEFLVTFGSWIHLLLALSKDIFDGFHRNRSIAFSFLKNLLSKNLTVDFAMF